MERLYRKMMALVEEDADRGSLEARRMTNERTRRRERIRREDGLRGWIVSRRVDIRARSVGVSSGVICRLTYVPRFGRGRLTVRTSTRLLLERLSELLKAILALPWPVFAVTVLTLSFATISKIPGGSRMPRIIAIFLLLAGWIGVQPAHAALITGDIAVFSVTSQSLIGYIQLTNSQDRYIVGSQSSADTFQTDTSASSPFSILDLDAPASHPFFAGLISPGIELRTTNANAAVLGDSLVSTAPGSTPQSGGSVSIPGAEYETAIWSLIGNDLSPRWVNHDGSQPSMSIVWDPVGQTTYLTANPAAVILNHPGSQTVSLAFQANQTTPPSTVPEPSTFALLSIGVGVLRTLARKRRIAIETK